jgi:hypothetical protein
MAESFPAPSAVTAAPNGDLVFEWHRPDGVFEQMRIAGLHDVTLSRVCPGQPATHRRVLGPR